MNTIYLINPTLQVVMAISEIPTLQQMYKLLDCRFIDVVRLSGTMDVFIVDDEALLFSGNDYNRIREVHSDTEHTIKGSMLYVGTSHEGETIFPSETIQVLCDIEGLSQTDIRLGDNDISAEVLPFHVHTDDELMIRKEVSLQGITKIYPEKHLYDSSKTLTIDQALYELSKLREVSADQA